METLQKLYVLKLAEVPDHVILHENMSDVILIYG